MCWGETDWLFILLKYSSDIIATDLEHVRNSVQLYHTIVAFQRVSG